MFLDACAIIYLLEGSDEKSDKVRQLVGNYLATEASCIYVSSLSILECLVLPKKQANLRLLVEYEAFFSAEAGSRYFCESIFGLPCPKKRQKLRDRSCLRLPQPSCFTR